MNTVLLFIVYRLYRRIPQVINDPGFSHVVTFILLMLCSRGHITNPYLTAKLVEVWAPLPWCLTDQIIVLLLLGR